MRRKIFTPLFILALFISSCGKKNETITRSFYYWKSGFSLGTDGNRLLNELGVKKLYVKFFDVDIYEEDAYPRSTLHVLDTIPAGIEIVPVVFLTNATLKGTSDYALKDLAVKIVRKIKGIQNCFTSITPIKEIQFDCDWSEETKDNYFSLLNKIQGEFTEPIMVTATIRLHQVKYFHATGVPPVKRGTLMFYNMGDIDDMNGESSIFNVKDASRYLVNFDQYPLPLDIALPVFSWAIVYREGKILGIINDFGDDLTNNGALTMVKENLYKVDKTIRYHDMTLINGDHVKVERSGTEEALSAAGLIKPYLAKDSITVTLFDFDYKNLSKYETQSIEKIFTRF
ncbi:MAG: hypothetical protein HOP08_05620 [Cyclobacteriaceae bacterium]|nr:hypothetical protein [Cyclobacteriaceae bacterium]